MVSNIVAVLQDKEAVMRSIDADFLKEWIDEYLSVFKKYDKGTIKGFVDHVPTIEPKRGEWLIEKTLYDNYNYRCSYCDWYECHAYPDVEPYNFCPNCGADMRKEGE